MSSGRFALEGVTSKELITYRGRIIWHDNPRELHYLFEKSVVLGTVKIIELPSTPLGRPFIRLRDHPDMGAVTFPLDENEFREGGE